MGNEAQLRLDKPSLKILFADQLNAILCAKKNLVRNLPALVELASFIDLRYAFEESLESAERQLEHLEYIFLQIKENITEERCQGMKAIIEEAFAAVNTTEEKSVTRDLAMIFYAKIIEHIEMISYRMLISVADSLGYSEIRSLLQENLEESKENDRLYMLIANEYGLEDHSKLVS